MQTLTKLHRGSIHSKIVNGKRIILPNDKEGLVLYSPFEEKEGNIVYDESKNNNSGNMVGAKRVKVTHAAPPVKVLALSFDGIEDSDVTKIHDGPITSLYATPAEVLTGGSTGAINGVIDECRIYNRAMSSTEILAIYDKEK